MLRVCNIDRGRGCDLLRAGLYSSLRDQLSRDEGRVVCRHSSRRDSRSYDVSATRSIEMGVEEPQSFAGLVAAQRGRQTRIELEILGYTHLAL